jgi:hypothetical protein
VACSDIAGATKASYTLKAEDLNGTLLKGPMRAVVSATNVAGFAEAPSNVVGTVVTGAPGAAGDGTAGAGGAATAAKRKKKLPKAKVAATVKRIAFSARGELVATLTCPRKARGACGVTGSIVGGKVRHGLAANGMKKGSTLVKRIKLKPAELKSLRRKRVLNVVLRVAAPATPTRPKVRRLRLRVPSKLSGLAVKKRKSAAKKTRSTPRP